MGTSWGASIDYLIDGLTNGKTIPTSPSTSVTIPPLSSINSVVQIFDGTPLVTCEVQVYIGRSGPESGDAGSGEAAYAEIGAQRIEESYTIPGFVEVFVPGPQQKPSRDAAIALFDGIVRLIHADPTFGGLLQRGRIGMVSRFEPYQTQDGDDMAGGDYMRTRIGFEVQVHNTYIP